MTAEEVLESWLWIEGKQDLIDKFIKTTTEQHIVKNILKDIKY